MDIAWGQVALGSSPNSSSIEHIVAKLSAYFSLSGCKIETVTPTLSGRGSLMRMVLMHHEAVAGFVSSDLTHDALGHADPTWAGIM